MTELGYMAFFGCTKIKDVYYGGSEMDWKKMDYQGEYVDNWQIHYNCQWVNYQ